MTPMAAKARAIAAAGADNFGRPGFEEGLSRALATLAALPLTPAAYDAEVAKIVGDLATRLRIERWYGEHPEVALKPIAAPVLVCGLPRTGTTATVAMLALDERFRFLRAWEGLAPVPPPIWGEEHADARVIAARAAARAYDKPQMHLHDPDGPEEDISLLAGYDLHAFYGALPMPDAYHDWWIAQDFRSAYAYSARILRLLQSRRPPDRWLLKSPPHLFKLAAFAECFPDTRFVMTHRDPAKVIASVSSLLNNFFERRMRPGTNDRHRIGRQQLALWSRGMTLGLAARAVIGEERFVDVYNADVIARPTDTFERIYAHLGLDLGPALRTRLAAYNRRNAPGAHGAHEYTLAEYGLTTADVHAAFGAYYDRFFPDVARVA